MTTLKIFCSYAPEDKKLIERLRAQLRVLEPQRVSIWYQHDILPGTEWEAERARQLRSAHIILFLVSPDFVSSYASDQKEIVLAMERQARGETRVIPIILRPIHWQVMPFGNLLPLPDGGKPVTDTSWKTQDHAFFNIAYGIKRVINDAKLRLPALSENGDTTQASIRSAHTRHDASTQLAQLMQGFKGLHMQIASIAYLRNEKGVTLDACENQYNKLYGDTMLFLATYLPDCVSDTSEGFVEIVYRKANELLSQTQRKGGIFVSFTRLVFSPLAALEKVGMQVNACIATLEFYRQKYFPEN